MVVVELVEMKMLVLSRGGGLLDVAGSGTWAGGGLWRPFSLSRTDLLRPRSANDFDLFFLAEGRRGGASVSPEDEAERSERDG